MTPQPVPIVKDLVLLGGGHAHVFVLKSFAMRPIPGVRLTLINRTVETPYSGMLPGLIAGHYRVDEAHIDLEPLAAFAQARFYHTEVEGLDLAAGKVHCQGRPAVGFDVLSVDVGATPRMNAVGAEQHAIPVKPIDSFLSRYQAMVERVLQRAGPSRIAVVGAGAGGVELILAVAHHLRQRCAAAGRSGDLSLILVSAADTVLAGQNTAIQQRFARILPERGIELVTGERVERVTADRLITESGGEIPCDEVLWVTQAGAAPWIAASGLACTEAGFMRVNEYLQSPSHPMVFAAGDISHNDHAPRPKAGVFAVRAGQPLADNLRRALLKQPLKSFTPQRDYLILVSTGEQNAVAARGRWAFEHPWMWRLKDWIDRRFMAKFQQLPVMEPPPSPLPQALRAAAPELSHADAAMRCGGCGAKVGSGVLSRVLGRLDPGSRPEVLAGLEQPDDAAVLQLPPGKVQVQSVDFFRSLVDDPYRMGQIAANHALNDLHAMAAEPLSALALITLPPAPALKLEGLLEDLLRGALDVLRASGAVLVGGHSAEGPELVVGFSVTGMADPGMLLPKRGLRPGDALILTKPLGTGVLFAARMRYQAQGQWIDAAITTMCHSNAAAVPILQQHGASACTDVSGFGLAGHLTEMLVGDGLRATLDLDQLPLLAGALDCIQRGFSSSLQTSNAEGFREAPGLRVDWQHRHAPLLLDPQTAGGLLCGVPADQAAACVAALRAAGYQQAMQIGTLQS